MSKLLVTFWQRHGCLPHVRAYGFWKAVNDRLQRFTIREIQRKVPALRKRHLQLFSGNAKMVKPHEAETLSIWVKMIGRSGDDTQEEEDDLAPAVSRSGMAGEDAVNDHMESPCCGGTNGMQAEGQAKGHQGLENEGFGQVHAGYRMVDAGTEEVDSSCCIEEPDDPEEVEEVEEEEEVEEMEGQQHGWNAAVDRDEPAQDNHQAFQQEAASPPNPKQEFEMLTCMTMANLASAVRTLAEIIACSHPVPV